MNFSSLPLNIVRALAASSLLIAAGCTIPTTPKPPAETAPPAPTAARVAEGAFDDDPRPVTPAEQIVNSAGLDAAKLAAAQQSLLSILQKPDAPAAERQEAAQQLGYILLTGDSAGHAATLNSLAPMLADPAQSDLARLALDRAPGASIDTLYLQALLSSSGRTQLGIIDAIGSRGIGAATPTLAGLLNNSQTTAAAASALGRIGGPAALEALAQAKDQQATVVVSARLAAAAKTDAPTAAKIAGEIYREPANPRSQRTAALRQLLAASPTAALEIIHDVLTQPEPAFHQVAIEAVTSLGGSEVGARLAANLAAYAPGVQSALIAALGQRNDASAVPGLLKVLDGSEASVRPAALDALGRLPGNLDVAKRLATLAAGNGDEAKAASAALTRLNGPGIDEFIRASAAGNGDDALRAVFIQQIANRNLTEAIPFLFSLRQSPVESLRLEALDALRLIALASDQQALIDWAVGTKDRTESARAVRALITLILRDGTVATRAAPVLAALESGEAAAKITLLPVLSRVAGAPAIATAAKLARSDDEAVAKAATAELTRWPDASAQPALIELVSFTSSSAIRDAATQGAARFLADRKNATPALRSLYTRQLLALPLEPTARNAMLHVLSLCADQEALACAKQFLTDAATAAAAQDAVDAITSNLAGAPAITASEEGDKSALMLDDKRNTFWSIPNAPGGWLLLDLHHSRPVRKITLDQGRREWDWPDRLEICVSNDPTKPGDVLFQMEGEQGQTIAKLPAGTRGRYVWLRQEGSRPNNAWAVAELLVE